jgi:intein/homing endonuclease
VKWRKAEDWLTRVLQPWLDGGRERFRRETRKGRTVELEADHHLFNSRPDRTLRELRAFLLGVQCASNGCL